MGRIAVAELRAKHNAYDRYDLPTRLVGLARSVHGAGRGTRCAEDGGDESCGPQWSAQTEKTDSMKKQLGFFQQVEGGPSMSPSSHADLARPSEWEISQTPATGLPEETGQSWSCRFDPCMPSLESKTIQRRSRSGHVVCVAIGRLCCWVLTLWVSTVLLWEPVSAANSSPYNRALSISENPAARELVLATWNQQKLREFVEVCLPPLLGVARACVARRGVLCCGGASRLSPSDQRGMHPHACARTPTHICMAAWSAAARQDVFSGAAGAESAGVGARRREQEHGGRRRGKGSCCRSSSAARRPC
jgi:hypothetical protein